MKIYVSGPISGLDRKVAKTKFAMTADYLRVLGHHAVDPMYIASPPNCGCPDTDGNVGHTWECCLRKDLAHLITCDAILMLSGWEASRGARLELHVALELGLTVYSTVGSVPPIEGKASGA